jgi:hypothetical protein
MNDSKFAKTFLAADGTRFEYGFRYLKGNDKPYFFISFETYDRFGRVDSCGTPSEAQVRESAPQLAGLVRWHLCDIDGRPVHYEANARYWSEKGRGVSRWAATPGEPNPVEAFKRHTVFGAVATDGTHEADGTISALQEEVELGRWLADRLPSLKNAFQADLACHELLEPSQAWWKRLQA